MAGRKASECVCPATLAGWDPVATIHIFLAAVMVMATARVLPAIGADLRPSQPTIRTINPTAAPWYELTALPRVGERADLDNVRGIGPITVRRIAPYLRFADE